MWSDDPVKDAEQYEYEKGLRIYELPECEECGDRIEDDYYYDLDGSAICPECMSKHKKWLW